MTSVNTPHDPLARKFLTDVSIARDFLQLHLPAKILEQCDLETLRLQSGSFIEDDLKVHCSDILYAVDLKDKSNTAYFYIVIEHQSRAEKFMPLRIIRYQLAIIQQHLELHGGKLDKLPLVIPVVFYNGTRSPYPYPCDINELFAHPELYQEQKLGSFKLVDLTVMKDSEILEHGKVAILEILQKHIRKRDFKALLELTITALKLAHDAGISNSLVDGAFSYLINAREEDEIKQLINEVKDKIHYYEENVMTYAEVLRREGRQEGIQLGEQRGIQLGKQEGIQLGKQEGKQEGIQLGKQEAQLQIAKELLQSGMNRDIVAKVTHLSLEQITTLN